MLSQPKNHSWTQVIQYSSWAELGQLSPEHRENNRPKHSLQAYLLQPILAHFLKQSLHASTLQCVLLHIATKDAPCVDCPSLPSPVRGPRKWTGHWTPGSVHILRTLLSIALLVRARAQTICWQLKQAYTWIKQSSCMASNVLHSIAETDNISMLWVVRQRNPF